MVVSGSKVDGRPVKLVVLGVAGLISSLEGVEPQPYIGIPQHEGKDELSLEAVSLPFVD